MEFELPPELWTEIFMNIYKDDLQYIKDVCRLFYDIIIDEINDKKWKKKKKRIFIPSGQLNVSRV